jgi:hypothetical protein
MHFLRDLRQRVERRLPELRRRAGAPPSAAAQARARSAGGKVTRGDFAKD